MISLKEFLQEEVNNEELKENLLTEDASISKKDIEKIFPGYTYAALFDNNGKEFWERYEKSSKESAKSKDVTYSLGINKLCGDINGKVNAAAGGKTILSLPDKDVTRDAILNGDVSYQPLGEIVAHFVEYYNESSNWHDWCKLELMVDYPKHEIKNDLVRELWEKSIPQALDDSIDIKETIGLDTPNITIIKYINHRIIDKNYKSHNSKSWMTPGELNMWEKIKDEDRRKIYLYKLIDKKMKERHTQSSVQKYLDYIKKNNIKSLDDWYIDPDKKESHIPGHVAYRNWKNKISTDLEHDLSKINNFKELHPEVKLPKFEIPSFDPKRLNGRNVITKPVKDQLKQDLDYFKYIIDTINTINKYEKQINNDWVNNNDHDKLQSTIEYGPYKPLSLKLIKDLNNHKSEFLAPEPEYVNDDDDNYKKPVIPSRENKTLRDLLSNAAKYDVSILQPMGIPDEKEIDKNIKNNVIKLEYVVKNEKAIKFLLYLKKRLGKEVNYLTMVAIVESMGKMIKVLTMVDAMNFLLYVLDSPDTKKFFENNADDMFVYWNLTSPNTEITNFAYEKIKTIMKSNFDFIISLGNSNYINVKDIKIPLNGAGGTKHFVLSLEEVLKNVIRPISNLVTKTLTGESKRGSGSFKSVWKVITLYLFNYFIWSKEPFYKVNKSGKFLRTETLKYNAFVEHLMNSNGDITFTLEELSKLYIIAKKEISGYENLPDFKMQGISKKFLDKLIGFVNKFNSERFDISQTKLANFLSNTELGIMSPAFNMDCMVIVNGMTTINAETYRKTSYTIRNLYNLRKVDEWKDKVDKALMNLMGAHISRVKKMTKDNIDFDKKKGTLDLTKNPSPKSRKSNQE